jgi:ABC-type branched-subunit amino acid transport system substrate-binding protein
MGPQISRIKAKSPDALFLILFGEDWATAIKQARTEGISVPIIGCQWDSQGQATTGSLDENYVYASYAFDPTLKNPFMQLYAPAYQNKYKTAPEIYDAFAYENTWFIADLVYRAVKAKANPNSAAALYEAFIKNPSAPASLIGKGYTWNKKTHEYDQPQVIYEIKKSQPEQIGLVVNDKLRLGETLSSLPGNQS